MPSPRAGREDGAVGALAPQLLRGSPASGAGIAGPAGVPLRVPPPGSALPPGGGRRRGRAAGLGGRPVRGSPAAHPRAPGGLDPRRGRRLEPQSRLVPEAGAAVRPPAPGPARDSWVGAGGTCAAHWPRPPVGRPPCGCGSRFRSGLAKCSLNPGPPAPTPPSGTGTDRTGRRALAALAQFPKTRGGACALGSWQAARSWVPGLRRARPGISGLHGSRSPRVQLSCFLRKVKGGPQGVR